MCALVFAFAAMPASLPAQVLYGTLVGTVTDSSESAVPGAAVKIVNAGTGQTWDLTTNESGGFSSSPIPAGTYDLTVTNHGFQTFTAKSVAVTANSTVRVGVALKVGSVAETLLVEASATVLKTDSADVRAEIRAEEFQSVPVPFTRNYQNLLITVPGMTPPVNAHSVPANPSRSLQVNANGTNSQSANFRVDGATTGHPWLPHIAGYVPSMDAIETVNIVANSFDAEQGYAGGAAVNVQIKSGTNQTHGSIYDYHFNQHLKARPYFLPASQDKEKRVVNQWGGTIGGPIVRNKLFYFAAFEGTFDRQAAFATISVPTRLMHAGNFTESTRLIYDPLTGDPDGGNRQPFAGNLLPAGRVSSIAKKLNDALPLPNLGVAGIANNYFVSGPFAFDRKTFDSKVTWHATNKLNLNGRVSYLSWGCDDPAALGELGGGGIGRCSYDGKSFGHTLSTTFSGVYTVSPRLTVDAYVGYTLYDARVEPIRLDEKLGTDYLGIPGTNGSERLLGGWPAFSVSGFRTIGRSNTNAPWYYHSPQSQYVINGSYLRGKHSLRFGYDSMLIHLNGDEPYGYPGNFSFGTGLTGIRNGTADGYNAYAGFLLGLTSSIAKTVTWEKNTERTFANSLYLRDKWQATRKLTVSVGLRWDYWSAPRRADRGMEVYDFSNNTLRLCGVGSVAEDCGSIGMGKKYFAPRLGVAYRVTDTLVLRAGYGIAFDPVNIGRNPLHSYPVQTAYSLPAANGNAFASRLADGIPNLTAPNLGSGVIAVPGTVSMELFDPRFHRGYVQSWNFMLEKDFGRGWIGEAGYAANGSRHLQNRWNANYGVIGGGTAGRVLNQRFGRTSDTNWESDTGGFTSSYQSLQSTMTRRFKNGLFAKFTYTFSKAIGPNGNGTGVDGYANHTPAYFPLNRAVQAYDRTQMFTASYGYELPFRRGNGLTGMMLRGWQLNGLFAAYTGTPFTVSSDATSLNAPANAQRADLVKSAVQMNGSRDSWFDPFAFATVTAPRFGTAGFNIVRAPGLVNFDSSIFRDFRAGERFKVQFRAEAFNLTNTPHFGGPGANVSSLQLNADGSIRNLNGFTVINGVQNTGREGVDERMFRFALRLSF
ncbi:MAG: TonB-dependent receptor [Candidatus Solibacter usitatus]|nr:TonB-dependent receptor [Candidatus Solibacter usitatus]